ncbi:MAG: hypothetical protein HQ567_04685 [Candidatus Nealsonbacteria bacterium]|nr:hypothetical protein [Candidatus Nealsonbacteria bacterium]
MTTTNSPEKPPLAGPARMFNGTDGKIWHKSAPAAVCRAFAAGKHADGWAFWQQHLRERSAPADLTSLTPGKSDPLAWALPERFELLPVPPWLQAIERAPEDQRPAREKELLQWLAESAGTADEAGYALEALACCRALPRLAAVLSSEVWWALLDHLLAAAADADGLEPDVHGEGDTALVHQLLAGELRLTLAYLFPEIAACRRLKSSARAALSAGFADLLDGEGLPHGNLLPLLRPLAACWTRCVAIGEQFKGGCCNQTATEQYEWLVRQTLRLLRRDGTLVFDAPGAKRLDGDLLAAALRFGGDGDDHEIAELLLSPKKSAKRPTDLSRLPKVAMHSQWASVAVLRRDWSRAAERLAVVYAGQSLRTEFACGKDVLFSGDWPLDVRHNGEPATPVDDWEESCWISDDDVDFLEVQTELSGGIRVQRQMLLAKQDRFLLLADAVLGDRPSGSGGSSTATPTLEYRSLLPLLPGVSFRGAEQSREGLLVGRKRRAMVLPLALPEWRASGGDGSSTATPTLAGELTRTDEGLQLQQSSACCRLYAPLLLDLDRRRMTRPLTWRRLTVAESLVVQPDDVAVGYRVSAGRQQWLIYRSLAKPANRTLLGHNLSSEMLVARFERSGEVEPLVEIE